MARRVRALARAGVVLASACTLFATLMPPHAIEPAHADDSSTGYAVTATLSMEDTTTELALSPDGNRVWVATGEGATGGLQVLDLTSDSALATFKVQNPQLVATDADGSLGFVAADDGQGNEMIHVFDIDTEGPLGAIPLKEAPVDLWSTGDGTRLLALHKDGSVSVCSTETMSVIANIAAGKAGNEEGRFVSDRGSEDVFVSRFDLGAFAITPRTGTVDRIMELPPGTRLFAVDTNGDMFLARGQWGETVQAVDTWSPETQQVVSSLELSGERAPKVDPALRRLYTASETKPKIIVRNLDTHDPLTTVTIAEPGEGFRISRDGSRLISFNRDSRTISVITAPPTVSPGAAGDTAGGQSQSGTGAPTTTAQPGHVNQGGTTWENSTMLRWAIVGLLIVAGGFVLLARRGTADGKRPPRDDDPETADFDD